MPLIIKSCIDRVKSEVSPAPFLRPSPTNHKVGNVLFYVCPFCGSGEGKNQTGALRINKNQRVWCSACMAKSKDHTRSNIDAVMAEKGVDYLTAVKMLADEGGIILEYENEPAKAPHSAATANLKPKEGKPLTEDRNVKQGQPQPKESTPQDFTDYYKQCRQRLNDPAAVEYLRDRGISLETAAAYNVGYDPAADPLNAPGALDGEPKKYPKPAVIFESTKQFYEYRLIKRDKYDKKNPKGTSPTLFNSQALYTQEVQEIFVTESIIDALSIIEVGGQAVATSSASDYNLLADKIKAKPTNAVIIICYDDDTTGRARAKDLQEELKKLNACNIMFDNSLFNGTKDANEALKKNRADFEAAILIAKDEAKRARQAAERAELERRRRTGAQMVDNFLQSVQTQKYKPLPTGIKAIDEAIGGGFIRQQLIMLGAQPGAGKTAMAQWIFENMAAHGQDCIYLNLEMTVDQILSRSLARIIASKNPDNRIAATEILQGYNWNDFQREHIMQATEEYRATIAPHMIYNPDGITPDLDSILEYLESEANRAEAAHAQTPAIVIDYLQIVRGGSREDDGALIKRAVASFKDFAIRHNTIVFCIMAHNRASNKSGTVSQESGRDTSAIEYSADLQMGIAYTECLPKDNGGSGKTIEELTAEERQHKALIITKTRWGKNGATAYLKFNGETMSYELDKRKANNFYKKAAKYDPAKMIHR